MLEATIHLVGNLADNPNITVLDNGAHLCRFRLVSSERRYDRKENRWVDGPSLFVDVTCWRRLAENVATTLSKGDRAVVIGRLQQREYETAQGEKRRPYQVTADAVGPELAFRPARIHRTGRGGAAAAQPGAAISGDTSPAERMPAGPAPREPDVNAPDDMSTGGWSAGELAVGDLDHDRYAPAGAEYPGTEAGWDAATVG
jgi:single-strand DNA-binding protein